MSDVIKTEFDETFTTKSGDDNDLKCGTIMFSRNTRFRYLCVFCSRIYSKMHEFFRHVLYDHLNYLEDYQLSEDEDNIGQKPNKIKHPLQEAECVVAYTDSQPPKVEKANFIKHYESFVNDLGLVCVKTELCDDDQEDVDQSAGEDVKPNSSGTSAQNGTQDILHIEILESSNEDEGDMENATKNEIDIGETQLVMAPSLDGDSNYMEDPEENAYDDSEEDRDEQINDVKIETKENAFECPKCTKTFLTLTGLKRHVTNSHGPKSVQLTCDRCGKTFRNDTQLELHIQRHMGVKPHTCEICGQCFSDKSNLNVHVLRHKGIRPHKCTICDKRFHSTTERKLHMRTHTGERPFVCEVCGRKFSNSGHLCSHRRRHYGDRRFECDQCSKRFFDRKLLNDHKVMHTDERPFACESCGATFQRRKALLQHEKLHSGLKQYVCKICGKSFAQNAGLYSHMKYH